MREYSRNRKSNLQNWQWQEQPDKSWQPTTWMGDPWVEPSQSPFAGMAASSSFSQNQWDEKTQGSFPGPPPKAPPNWPPVEQAPRPKDPPTCQPVEQPPGLQAVQAANAEVQKTFQQQQQPALRQDVQQQPFQQQQQPQFLPRSHRPSPLQNSDVQEALLEQSRQQEQPQQQWQEQPQQQQLPQQQQQQQQQPVLQQMQQPLLQPQLQFATQFPSPVLLAPQPGFLQQQPWVGYTPGQPLPSQQEAFQMYCRQQDELLAATNSGYAAGFQQATAVFAQSSMLGATAKSAPAPTNKHASNRARNLQTFTANYEPTEEEILRVMREDPTWHTQINKKNGIKNPSTRKSSATCAGSTSLK